MNYQVTLRRVVHAEWTKVRAVRSTWIVLAVALLVTVGLAGAFGHGYGGRVSAGEVAGTPADAVDATFIGLDLLALVVGVFGVLQLSGEYGSGLIRVSLTAVPRRWQLITAKALVLLVLLVPLSVGACVASFLVCQAFAISGGASLGDNGVLRAVLGAAAYPVATALIGLSIGGLARSTAGSVTVYVAGYLVVPALLPAALPERIQDDTLQYLPITAGQAIYAMGGESGPVHLLSPPVGAMMLTAWVVAFVALGALVLHHRDA